MWGSEKKSEYRSVALIQIDLNNGDDAGSHKT